MDSKFYKPGTDLIPEMVCIWTIEKEVLQVINLTTIVTIRCVFNFPNKQLIVTGKNYVKFYTVIQSDRYLKLI